MRRVFVTDNWSTNLGPMSVSVVSVVPPLGSSLIVRMDNMYVFSGSCSVKTFFGLCLLLHSSCQMVGGMIRV